MKLNLNTRILAGPAVAIALMFVMGITGWHGMTALDTSIENLAVEGVERYRKTVSADRALGDAHANAYRTITWIDSYKGEKLAAVLTTQGRILDEVASTTDALQDGADRQQSASIEIVRSELGTYRKQMLEALDMAADDPNMGMMQMQGADGRFLKMRQAFSALIEAERSAAAEAREQAGRTYKTVLGAGAVALLLAIVLSAAVGLTMARRVSRQVGGEPEEAAGRVRAMARGRLDGEIPVQAGDRDSIMASLRTMQETIRAFVDAQTDLGSRHEAGEISARIPEDRFEGAYLEMARRVNTLIDGHVAVQQRTMEVIAAYAQGDFSGDMDRLPGDRAQITRAVDSIKANFREISSEVLKLSQAASRGDFSVRGDAARFKHACRNMVESLNTLMERADEGLSEVARALDAMARGDLSVRIEARFEGTFGKLRDDTNRTAATLSDIVRRIREGSESIRTASSEIAAGNQDLSQRTEEQASSLQQTAASMEQFTATVKQNADSATKANELAASAARVAERGGGAVSRVESTMNEISDSSRRIADIIGVIDGIAFQTNILALNAAVEAARAGHQGRGFAVVASEVRILAQRSSEAAQEIKSLIKGSAASVESGSALVAEAGTTMAEIVAQVRKVTSIVSEIHAASREQAEGIDQVNQAIAQMDQVTQQNAALVEQAAAAAEAMREQAQDLASSVMVFKAAPAAADPRLRLAA